MSITVLLLVIALGALEELQPVITLPVVRPPTDQIWKDKGSGRRRVGRRKPLGWLSARYAVAYVFAAKRF